MGPDQGGQGDGTNEDGPYQILGTYRGENYGLIDIDAETRSISMGIYRSEDGKQVRALQIPISLLQGR